MMAIIFVYNRAIMKTTTGRKALSHQRIVQSASRALRRDGFDGVGVADVMKSAGLTHGGFYAHFDSRDALLVEAMEAASRDIVVLIDTELPRLQAQGMSAFRALVELYLSDGHVHDCEHGCPVPTLCAEIPRQAPAVLEASRHILIRMHALVERVLSAHAPPAAAWAVVGALAGAVQLARALGDSDEARAVLAETRSELLARYDT